MATRGTLLAVTNNNVIRSTEFNGDAYPENLGIFYMEMLERVKTTQDFTTIIKTFNANSFFNYNDCDIVRNDGKGKYFTRIGFLGLNYGFMDMNRMEDKQFFELYFSDWFFIKNLSDKPFGIKTREHENDGTRARTNLILLLPSEQVALQGGSWDGNFKTADEGRNTYNDIHNFCEKGRLTETQKNTIFESVGGVMIAKNNP